MFKFIKNKIEAKRAEKIAKKNMCEEEKTFFRESRFRNTEELRKIYERRSTNEELEEFYELLYGKKHDNDILKPDNFKKCVCGTSPICYKGQYSDSQCGYTYVIVECNNCGYSIKLTSDNATYKKAALEWNKKIDYVQDCINKKRENSGISLDVQSEKTFAENYSVTFEEISSTLKKYIKNLKDVMSANETLIENYESCAFQLGAADAQKIRDRNFSIEMLIEDFENSIELIEQLY